MFVGEFEHAVAERCGEQQVLAFRRPRHFAQQKADVLDEAEIEHAIGFVHHHDFDAAEFHRTLTHEIDQAAGGRDDDVDAFLELAALLVVIDAAVDQGTFQFRIAADLTRILVDLYREFARRRDHDGTRVEAVVFRVCGAHQQVVVQRDEESRGLAGAGLRLAGDVFAFECQRQGHRLDRRTADEVGLVQAFQQQRVEVEIFETDIGEWFIRHFGSWPRFACATRNNGMCVAPRRADCVRPGRYLRAVTA